MALTIEKLWEEVGFTPNLRLNTENKGFIEKSEMTFCGKISFDKKNYFNKSICSQQNSLRGRL